MPATITNPTGKGFAKTPSNGCHQRSKIDASFEVETL